MYKGWSETAPNYWTNAYANWLNYPIRNNKYYLVSWRMSGSEFSKELIRENFPETVDMNMWAKSHAVLEEHIAEDILREANTKVFVIISDPREVAANIINFDAGTHLHKSDYPKHIYNNLKSSTFLSEVTNKQIQLVDTYKRQFKDNCIVLRYEDALFYQDEFLDQVSNFLNLKPLFIDDVRKYKWSIYKNVGDFHKFFHLDILEEHYNEFRWFYDEWDYPKSGLQYNRYNWFHQSKTDNVKQLTEDYSSLLSRNGIKPTLRTSKNERF
jgi:hypothetical protein